VTDQDLVAKKLAFIETCLRELSQQARPDSLSTDVREMRFVEHTLQIAIQAALDVASHIVSDNRLGEPRTNRDLFDLLGRHGWITPALASVMRDMGGFRNVLVRGYAEVDVSVVRDVLDRHLPDFEAFVAAIRQRMGGIG
jgi:uncharacterized protein YutE (UPF0331/DUF86 family)